MKPTKRNWSKFGFKIILPSLLAIILFVFALFYFIIPLFEQNMIDRKREMIKELTQTSWSILQELNDEFIKGQLNLEEAQNEAIARIRYLRYGPENKDYFWITDMHPTMMMHPFRPELEGTDLSLFSDPHQKKLFVEMVKVCQQSGKGYVDYMWQWKDDSTRIVPKLSYVQEFKPWGWIIGTGIYIEDVTREIKKLETNLVNISISIVGLISLLLILIMIQSSKIERRRIEAEKNLLESREKYKVLVQSSTEGTMLILDGRFLFANEQLHDILGYNEGEILNLTIYDVFLKENIEDADGLICFRELRKGNKTTTITELPVKKKDGSTFAAEVITRKILVVGKTGYTMIIRDISKEQSTAKEWDDYFSFRDISENMHLGIFRCSVGKKSKFLKANATVMKLLEIEDKQKLLEISIFELFPNRQEKKAIISELNSKGLLNYYELVINPKSKQKKILSLSLKLIKDSAGEITFCDGIMEDITFLKKSAVDHETAFNELVILNSFVTQPVSDFLQPLHSVPLHTSIPEASRIMSNNKSQAILVHSSTAETIGLVTESDITYRAVSGNIELSTPVYKIMTSPIFFIPQRSQVFEALIKMQEKNIETLVAINDQNELTGIITYRNFLNTHRNSIAVKIQEIRNSNNIDNLISISKTIPQIVKPAIENDSDITTVTKTLSLISDNLTSKLIEMAIDQIGKPPCQFAFIGLGSVGREEQTLKTDQDNAIIFEDLEPNQLKNAESYFLNLGKIVCSNLNDLGYSFCPGGIMAMNAKWCQPISVWKMHFKQWVKESDPEGILESSIFFDFRNLYGDIKLTSELKSYLFGLIENQHQFFYHLAKSSLEYKPPLTLMGNISIEKFEKSENALELKKVMMPVVSIPRVLSLQNKLNSINTYCRIKELSESYVIKHNTAVNFHEIYQSLMKFRFRNQLFQIENGKQPNNYLLIDTLKPEEIDDIKKALVKIANIQSQISYLFTGHA